MTEVEAFHIHKKSVRVVGEICEREGSVTRSAPHLCSAVRFPTYPGFRLLSQKLMRLWERQSSRGCSSALGSRSSEARRSDWASRTTVAEQLVSYSIMASEESSLNIMATSTLVVAFSWKLRGTVWRRSNG